MPSETISLYIDMQKDQKADLEVVARAGLAFADAIREIAGFIDPFSDTKLELISTTEGSISLNTKIKFRAAGKTYEITLYALLLVFSSYIAVHLGEFVFEKATTAVWEHLFGEQEAVVSDKDKEDIVSRAVKAMEAKAGERQIQRLYAELNEDPAVVGVGVSKEPGVRPSSIVPRNEFAKRSGFAKIEEPAEKKRVRREISDAILVSPILENDRKRRWKFRIGEVEFGAPIKDHVFLDAVFSGKHPILMKGSTHMRIALETNEEFVDGVWVSKERVVWSVLSVPGQYQGPQELLPFDEQEQTSTKPKCRR